jgi:hypothetical protein
MLMTYRIALVMTMIMNAQNASMFSVLAGSLKLNLDNPVEEG